MEWLSVLPPVIAILIVLWKKEVILALLTATFVAELLITFTAGHSWLLSPLNTVDRIMDSATSPGNARILVFSLVVGALMAFMRDSGGVSALVNRLVSSGIATSKRRVGSATFITGALVFIESNLSVLTAGIFARGLFDKFNMSRARLAYILDSTCAPICILVLLNGWGAFVLGLLDNYELPATSAQILWGTVPLNFYAIITLLLVVYSIASDKVIGPMADEEAKLSHTDTTITASSPTKARFMLLPLSVMIVSMFGFMWWTGNGDITSGSGSKSVLYATVLATVSAYILLISHGRYHHDEAVKVAFKGMGELLPLVTIVLLSVALGASLKVLGTGVFVAGIVGESLPTFLIFPALFVAGGIMSFTTGTSWGTFAILVPIGAALIQSLGLPPALVIAAILGGGIFGDHCSPISDTTAVSALASGSDMLVHVKTQLPYAMIAGGLTLLAYTFAGLMVM